MHVWRCMLQLVSIGSAVACVHDSRDLGAVSSTHELRPTEIATRSWGLCSLIGPLNHDPGVYGTDLGFSARVKDDKRLTLLFGDTWAEPTDACKYPVSRSDDLRATLPVERPAVLKIGPPSGGEAAACQSLEYKRNRPDDVTSWERSRLFPNTIASSEDSVMDTSSLRTPLAAFSDGERLFGIFHRNDPAYCSASPDCPSGMVCSADAAYTGKPLGECASSIKLSADAPPAYCRDGRDCALGVSCNPVKRGVCLATKPFQLHTPQGDVVPTWYREDLRRGIARTVYVAAAVWPDRRADYAVLARFVTNRFQNLAARTIANFDPEHPERNDYRPGYHTLLIWGREAFAETGGAQTLPFLMYQPLADLRGDPEKIRWHPRFFAGYDAQGKVRWSDSEEDVQPVYGAEASLVEADGPKLKWAEPEFDYVNQMTVSWIEPLQRWVMLYGGDVPAFMVLDIHTGHTREPVHLQWAAGAIHMRVAAHPWGRERRDGPDSQAWSSAEPVVTRQSAARFLACGDRGEGGLPGCLKEGDPHGPFDLLATLAGMAVSAPKKFADVAASCIGGEFAHGAQMALSGDPVGRLYGPNILDDWTEEVTDQLPHGSGERLVELYWNVSTWNPYQVVLFKTLLRGSGQGAR